MSYPHYSSECHEYHHLVRDFHGDRPLIVCLCGSSRFSEAFQTANRHFTALGRIVLSIGVFKQSEAALTPKLKSELDELHKRKIDLADQVWVLNIDGYIGQSTRSEIEYAERHGKPVFYWEPLPKAGAGAKR